MGCANSTYGYEETVKDFNHAIATVIQPQDIVHTAICLIAASDNFIYARLALDVAITDREKAWHMLDGSNASAPETYHGQGVHLFVASQVDVVTALTTHDKAWCKLADATVDHNAAVKASANFTSSWKAFLTARTRFQTCIRIEEHE
jgi:hypothetical protein